MASGNKPWKANFTYVPNFDSLAAECIARQEAQNDTIIKMATEILLEERATEYFNRYSTHCLDSLEESLSYSYTPKEYHYTLYYYDQVGNLVQTVPPKGVKPLSESQVEEVKRGNPLLPSHEMATRYRYNSRNQLVRQQSPDAGESRFWYNKAGQLRLSQDARQKAENAYSYTKYDAQGRIKEVGEMLTGMDPDSLQYFVQYIRFPEHSQYTCYDITRTGYDRPKAGADSSFVQENLRGRVSWTALVEKEAADTVHTFYSYDPHGNVKSLLQHLPGIGYKRTDYVYDLVSGNVNFVLYQYGEEEQFIHRYTYDADNRIRDVQTSTDGFIWNSEARYIYYPHGPLARVELGEYNVQGLDYYYTLQGWLKGVNMPMEGDPGTDGENGLRTGGDAFAFSLGYHEGDYTPINPNVTLSDGRDKLWERYKEQGDSTLTGLYNGNISWMNTDLSGLDANQRMQAMVYGYDQLHRIVQARSLTEYKAGTGYAVRETFFSPWAISHQSD